MNNFSKGKTNSFKEKWMTRLPKDSKYNFNSCELNYQRLFTYLKKAKKINIREIGVWCDDSSVGMTYH